MAHEIKSADELSPMQKIIIDLVEDGYTLKSYSVWSMTYGKGDHRVTVHHDATTAEWTAAAGGGC